MTSNTRTEPTLAHRVRDAVQRLEAVEAVRRARTELEAAEAYAQAAEADRDAARRRQLALATRLGPDAIHPDLDDARQAHAAAADRVAEADALAGARKADLAEAEADLAETDADALDAIPDIRDQVTAAAERVDEAGAELLAAVAELIEVGGAAAELSGVPGSGAPPAERLRGDRVGLWLRSLPWRLDPRWAIRWRAAPVSDYWRTAPASDVLVGWRAPGGEE